MRHVAKEGRAGEGRGTYATRERALTAGERAARRVLMRGSRGAGAIRSHNMCMEVFVREAGATRRRREGGGEEEGRRRAICG